MKYVENNLMDGEHIIYDAQIHWFIFIPSIMIFVLSLLFNDPIRLGMAIISISMFINAVIFFVTTEFAVTSKRVITKVGLIRRNTNEMKCNQIESFIVEQSILGRMLNFGTIVVRGTGGGQTIIANVDSPLKFKKEAMLVINS